MKVTFAEHEGRPQEEVEAEETPIKGYAGFHFFIFKHPELKKWFVCEHFTGQVIAEGDVKAETKRAAREKLNVETGKDKTKLQAVIDSEDFINPDVWAAEQSS